MLGWTVLSQLKQDPETRHIPVQIVTLDEDRQHGLARGAFSFLTKPTTTEGCSSAHLDRIKATPSRAQAAAGRRGQRRRADEHRRAARPRRHRDRHRRHRRRGARGDARSSPSTAWCSTCGCPTCPASRCSSGSAGRRRWRRLPVVVFTGASCRRGGAPAAHAGRSVVVKGVESPERLLDETALFLHRVSPTCPPRSSRCSSGCTARTRISSASAVLVVDDDVRNIFALSSVLERRGMKVLTASTGREAIELLERTPGPRRSC